MTLLRMAASYRHSADLIRVRIIALKDAAKTAGPAEKSQLEQRIRDLNILYRETRETALVLERYYDNYHFEEEVRNDDVLFSYRLLEGRAHTRNAIKLLEIIGLSKEIIRRADDMARAFLADGEWSAE